ncbi:sulfurtransferase [Paenibacillus puerhi]|uniref:sulfurtransferase n=1 Tax=Paenibacillus puerhi TaxID=2692622 RepID=UPI001F43501F|nr:sulfurtransferase [Paenibacillus puerhi]
MVTDATAYEFEYPQGHLLADIDWLDENRAAPGVVLLDARAKGYEEGHIPGAVQFDVKVLKDAYGHTFASEDAIRQALEQSGVDIGSTIVVYDDGQGVLATRLFYVLEYVGFRDRVKLLNGGYTAWTAAGKHVSTEAPDVRPGTLAVSPDARLVATRESLQVGVPNSLLLDARSAGEYTGQDARDNRKAGHIPGAVHKEWKESLGPADPQGVVRFKAYAELKRELEELGADPQLTVIPYCQSNQRGAHAYFVLRLMGYPDVRPYEGSWDEWGNSEGTTVSTGEA